MKKKVGAFILIGMLGMHFVGRASIVTYVLNGGRFGDNLLSYSKAKWLSYTYSIPFYYKPFPYSDQLQLSIDQKRYTSSVAHENGEEVLLPKYKVPVIDPFRDCVYINQWYAEVTIDWNDRAFIEELKKDIIPIYDLE